MNVSCAIIWGMNDAFTSAETKPLQSPWNTEVVHGAHKGIPSNIRTLQTKLGNLTLGDCPDPECEATFLYRWTDHTWTDMPDQLI